MIGAAAPSFTVAVLGSSAAVEAVRYAWCVLPVKLGGRVPLDRHFFEIA